MENSSDETTKAGAKSGVGIHKDRIDKHQVAITTPGSIFTKFERIESRKQVVPGFVEAESADENINTDSIPATSSEDCLNPMLRTGSQSKPDQEHKKP